MSYNRGSSRRGGRGGNDSSRSYNRRRNSAWNNGRGSSSGRSETDYSDRRTGESDDSYYDSERESDSYSVPSSRQRTSTTSSRSRYQGRSRRRGSPNIDTNTILIVAGIVVAILAIVLIVSSVQTNGAVLKKIGQSITQICYNILFVVFGAAIIWAIVCFSLFRDYGGRFNAILYVIILVLLIMAMFNSTLAVTILVLLILAAILKRYIKL